LLRHTFGWVRTYSDATAGELVSLFSSDGFFEIAVVNGNAAMGLNAAVGMKAEVRFGCNRIIAANDRSGLARSYHSRRTQSYHSTVTLLARLRGLSTSQPRRTATS
jgi:hypothetical protein